MANKAVLSCINFNLMKESQTEVKKGLFTNSNLLYQNVKMEDTTMLSKINAVFIFLAVILMAAACPLSVSANDAAFNEPGVDLESFWNNDTSVLKFNNPVWSSDDRFIALSDNHHNGVYIYDVNRKTVLQITDAPSSGYVYNWDKNHHKLGFKLLVPVNESESFLQVPVIFDVDKRELNSLHDPVQRAGTPSFSNEGTIVFTIGEELHVFYPNNHMKKIRLDHYANITPISPNGLYVAYNDHEGQISIINHTTRQKHQNNFTIYFYTMSY